jgi:hypothetical protein
MRALQPYVGVMLAPIGCTLQTICVVEIQSNGTLSF